MIYITISINSKQDMKEFTIHHEPGFILDKNRYSMGKYPGIYIVYKCDYDKQNDTVNVKEVLYIGETEDLFKRHNSEIPHEHYNDFVKYAGGKEHLCYGIIPLPCHSDEDRKTIEAAMIHIQRPQINTDHKNHYTKPASDITMTGGPDCWKTKHFIHPFDYGDEIILDDTLQRYLEDFGPK